MSFANTIRRRLILLVFVVFGVSVVTFVISHMIPGDPARMMAGERATNETVAHIRAELGLDKPVPVQYIEYVRGLLHGNFGVSIRTQRPVIDDILLFFPATIELAVAALLLAIILGIPLGVLSAVAKDRAVDQVSRTISVTGISTPAFWLGLLLIYVFYGRLVILPGSGRIASDIPPPPAVTGFYTIDALIPSVTMIGLAFGDLLYGAVPTETVFAWPGMGNYVVQSITALDFPAIMGFTVVASTAYVLLNMLVDLVYMALDPQIREVG